MLRPSSFAWIATHAYSPPKPGLQNDVRCSPITGLKVKSAAYGVERTPIGMMAETRARTIPKVEASRKNLSQLVQQRLRGAVVGRVAALGKLALDGGMQVVSAEPRVRFMHVIR